MQNLKFLNSKEKREIKRRLKENYGFSGELEGSLLLSSKEEKIFLLSGAELLPDGVDKRMRVDRAGLYIGKLLSNGVLLNVEGSQLVGPHAAKNILELDEAHLELWVKGEDLELSAEEKMKIGEKGKESGVFIVRHGNDFLGCAIIKDGKALNQLSKNRRVKNLNR